MSENPQGSGGESSDQLAQFRSELRKGFENDQVVEFWGVDIFDENTIKSEFVLNKFLNFTDFNCPLAVQIFTKTMQWRVENNLRGNVGEGYCGNIFSIFEKSSCYIDFDQLLDNEATQLSIQQNWFSCFERVVRKILSSSENYQPNLVIVIDFSKQKKRTSLLKKKQLLDAINETKLYYPNTILDEVFIGGCGDWLITHWNGKGKNFTTTKNAYKRLFRLLHYPQLVCNEQVTRFHRSYMVEDNQFIPHSGNVDVPHAKIKTVRIQCARDSTVALRVYVIMGWEVTFTVDFVPHNADSFPVILHRREFINQGHYPGNMFYKVFRVPEDGVINLTVENSSFLIVPDDFF